MPASKKRTSAAAVNPPKKRKLDKNLPKFYAVRCGYRPGVYYNWNDCERQTTGFKGAQYKSFLTKEEAEAFVAGLNPGGRSDQTERYYAVAIGSRPGVYTDWAEAQKAYSGVKGPKYRKFLSRAAAEEYVRMFGNGVDEDEDGDDDEDGEDETQTETNAENRLLEIYTDGSSMGNGKTGAIAGVGVYFGEGDPRNVSETLQGEPQTNQRAELTAILRALGSVEETQGVQIFSDSKYSINCLTEWYKNWESSGWKTKEGNDVKNRDLIQPIRELIDERDAVGAITRFVWVKGHSTNPGNIEADKLATQGARKPR